MSAAKTYTAVEVATLVYKTNIDPDWVRATDFDSLLAVLRRCVEAMEKSRESILAEWSSEEAWPDEEGIDDALAAAREYTEAKP